MLNSLRKLKKKARTISIVWRYGFNLKPTLRYQRMRPELTGELKTVIDDLNRNGIAISSAQECLGSTDLFDELDGAVNRILDERENEINEIRNRAGNLDSIGDKTFNVQLLGDDIEFDYDSVFARFALQKPFLDIANSYFGMNVKLRYYNVWYTLATESDARESQLWHFDREDHQILKIFCYLRDVDEGTGPFTYAPGSHQKGSAKNVRPEFFLEGNVQRSTDEQMSKHVPTGKWIKAVGKKGSIVFADTRGYHKGGEARTNDRLMFVAMFTSPASDSKRLLRYSNQVTSVDIKDYQKEALEIVLN